MSWLSDLWDWASDGVSSAFTPSASSATGGGGGEERSWLGELLSPANIASGISAFGTASAQKEAAKLAADRTLSFDEQLSLKNLEHEQAKELLQLRAALGDGGSAGAQIAAQKALERYRGRLAAAQGAMRGSQGAAELTVKALDNLRAGAQTPLVYR